MIVSFEDKLQSILEKEQISINEPMHRHTTFRVGGPADYYIRPRGEQIPAVMKACREEGIPVQIIGKGSNLLVGDKGIRGLVLEIGQMMDQISIHGECIEAQAGVTLAKIAKAAFRAGLTGLEFAEGIPGTVGGAVVMNAGAYGGEIKNVLTHAEILDEDGKIKSLSVEELELSYRHSCFPKRKGVVLKAVFQLETGNSDEIKSSMEELRNRRMEKQPLEFPSAGSTFKRPEGYFAGKLIMDAGLTGYQIGGAEVSKKHCGFVINKGNATAKDILLLMEEVTKKVEEKFGVELIPEVKIIGEF